MSHQDGNTDTIEATSLLSEPLHRPTFPDDVRERLETQLAEAQTAYEAAPAEQTLAPDPHDTDKGMGDNQALMDATVGYGVGKLSTEN